MRQWSRASGTYRVRSRSFARRAWTHEGCPRRAPRGAPLVAGATRMARGTRARARILFAVLLLRLLAGRPRGERRRRSGSRLHTPSLFLFLIQRAEDRRRPKDIPDAQSSRDPAIRGWPRGAFARILGDDDAPLLRALEDDDATAVAWAAYGLGESCGGREGAHVRALASRLASLAGAAHILRRSIRGARSRGRSAAAAVSSPSRR